MKKLLLVGVVGLLALPSFASPVKTNTLIRGLLSNMEFKEVVADMGGWYTSLEVTKVDPASQVAACGDEVYSRSASVIRVRLNFGQENAEQMFFVTPYSSRDLTMCETFDEPDFDELPVLEF